jgi:peroxiredoxin
VLGISTDKLADQQKFVEKEKLEMPLLADTDQKVAKEFGSLRPTGGFANRETFIIDKEGKIRKIYRGVKNAGGHNQDVLKYIKENLGSK